MATATLLSGVESAGSHHIGFDPHRGTTSKEEVYPVIRVDWRGEEIAVKACASRYVASDATLGDVLTPWHIYLYESDPYVTATAVEKIRPLIEEPVREWLESDAYKESRRAALGHMIRRSLREEAAHLYGDHPTRTTRKLLALIGQEIDGETLDAFYRGCELIDLLGEIL